jgi:DNA (cytosine-5)-methyltransferase 1
MEEIKKLPHNGYNVISTFSGCGGSSLGYKMAGYKVLWANEFIPAAQEVYKINHPDTILDTRDIRTVSGSDILEAINMRPGELDLFDGSPPCASFSTAGKREDGWGKVKKYSDTVQRTDDLFYEYVRLITEIQPKVFVAENVSGLVKGSAKGYFLDILSALKSAGYRVSCKLLNSQWLGVPQARQRTIFIGVREDINIAPIHPDPFDYFYSINDAIDLSDEHPDMDISAFAIGKEWHKMKIGSTSDKYFSLVRPLPSLPCPTITATVGNMGAASVVHPTQCRNFSISELKRLSSFPDDFVLVGSYQQQAERIGRAVPPVMMKQIARTIDDYILSRINI